MKIVRYLDSSGKANYGRDAGEGVITRIDGDIFRDFDLVTFLDHFGLGSISETALCIAFRACNKADLRNKGRCLACTRLFLH